jgi:DNA-binding NarL/FixJ family response regulator
MDDKKVEYKLLCPKCNEDILGIDLDGDICPKCKEYIYVSSEHRATRKRSLLKEARLKQMKINADKVQVYKKEGLSNAEISNLMNISESAVRTIDKVNNIKTKSGTYK